MSNENLDQTLDVKSYLIVLLDGIESPAKDKKLDIKETEVRTQLIEKNGSRQIDIKTVKIYNYNTGNATEDSKEVLYNAFNNSSDIINNSNEICSEYEKQKFDYVYFIGYSGGGVSASKTADFIKKNEKSVKIDRIFRVGSPKLDLDKSIQEKIVDFQVIDDPMPIISLPFGFGIKTTNIIINGLIIPRSQKVGFGTFSYYISNPFTDIHTSYWLSGPKYTDKNGVSNITKTISNIINYMN